jgi:hypothetical protein
MKRDLVFFLLGMAVMAEITVTLQSMGLHPTPLQQALTGLICGVGALLLAILG